MKCLYIYFVTVSVVSAVPEDICETCVPALKCPLFGNLSKENQQLWTEKFSCGTHEVPPGFASFTKGDFVCCSNNIWEVLNQQPSSQPNDKHAQTNSNYYLSNKSTNQAQNVKENSRKIYWNDRPNREWNFGNQNNANDYKKSRGTSFENNQPQQPNGNHSFINQGGGNRKSVTNTNLHTSPNQFNNYPHNNNVRSGSSNPGNGQCDHLTSFPPDPESGCCGREVSDDDRITGGQDTELYQYPWTVLLETTFLNATNQQSFFCGGSLISAKYVLSAAHCVSKKDAALQSIQVNLAEYDLSTYPRDCTVSRSESKCVENKLMYAEEVTVHNQYETQQLYNDISLIRLLGTAPYTEYIRPLCLPTINFDKPEFSNLPLEVTGWGSTHDKKTISNVKQSTVLHLVNNDKCRRYFYPLLSTKQLCAVGYEGAGACKGDSGGPLMILYRGKYYVSGVVSGGGSNIPCGTVVPSSFTNVYLHLDWIRSNIRK